MLKDFLQGFLELFFFTSASQKKKAKKEIHDISKDLESYLESRHNPLYDWVKNLPGFNPEGTVLTQVQTRVLDDAIAWAEYELTKRAVGNLERCTVNSSKREIYKEYLNGMHMKNREFYKNRAKKDLTSMKISTETLETIISSVMHGNFIFHRMNIT